MTTDTGLARTTDSLDPAALESLVLRGDIAGLSPTQRVGYYTRMCAVLGLDPATQPLAYLRLSGKEVLYVTRGATDRLAAMHGLNREIIDGPRVMDLAGTKLVYAVCRATLPCGRYETATATVPLTDPVNVLMKCETKCKRRATLAILGLGLLDESELAGIPASAMEPAQQPVLAAETDDHPEDSSRAMAEYIKALEDAERPSQVRAAYLAMQDGLRGERKDPDDWTKAAHAEALDALRAMGWSPTTAELGQLLGASAESHDLAAMLDKPTDLDASAMPLWWMGHREAVQGLHRAHQGIVWRLVACKHAGLSGEPDGAATKRATAGLKTAIAALPVEAPPAAADPDAPFPRGEPGADDNDESWYASPASIREYLAGKGTRREVERAVRKHAQRLRSDAARLTFANASVARLAEIAATRPGSDGTMPTTETLRRDVAQWSDEGPVSAKGGV